MENIDGLILASGVICMNCLEKLWTEKDKEDLF